MAKFIFPLIALAASVALALGWSCGTSVKGIRPTRKNIEGQRIIGGQPARPNSHPWIVSIQDKRGHICGGSLIRIGEFDETDIVVTAAHCVSKGFQTSDSKPVATVTVGVNRWGDRTDPFQQTVDIEGAYYHDDFIETDDTVLYDIAILKLVEPIKFNSPAVEPVCLPEPGGDAPEGTEGIVAGWGYTNIYLRRASDILMQLGVPTLNITYCAEQYRNDGITFEPELMFCAGYAKGGNDSCEGDSGGPFTVQGANGYVLHGVVSFGYGCASAGFPGVYVRVTNFLDWLDDQVRDHSSLAGASVYGDGSAAAGSYLGAVGSAIGNLWSSVTGSS